MKKHQQECSEIHTIQIFREASSCIPRSSLRQCNQQCPGRTVSIQSTTCVTPTSQKQDGTSYAIGCDWAIEMDEDLVEEPSTLIEMKESNSDGQSSLYSFYFETPLISIGQDQSFDEYTITANDTDSFHDSNDFDSDSMDDIWEQGLTRSVSCFEMEK